jgi:hypothetical protein
MSESTQDQKQEKAPEQTNEQKQEELIQTEPVYKGSDVQKFIDEANLLKAKLKQIEQEKKQKEIEELTKNNEWQKIADMNAAKAAEYEDNYNKLKTALVNDKKMSAIKDAAIQSGLLKEALPLLAKLDFPEVTIENNGQGVSVTGIDRAIQRIKATSGFMFSKSVPNVNTASPSVNHNSSATITWDDLKKAEADAKKTGKYETYKDLVLKYKAQS